MSDQPDGTIPEYLIIGHITRDLIESGFSLGGTAVYSSLVGQRLGIKTAVFTACEEGLPLEVLDGIQVYNQGSEGSTTFKNEYTAAGRIQHLRDRAVQLNLDLLPQGWNQARIVHLAPVIGEVNLDAWKYFQGSAVFYSLQGWLRKWGKDGIVTPSAFPEGGPGAFLAEGAFLSIEDLGFTRSQLDLLIRTFPQLVFTLGKEGAELYQHGKLQIIPAFPAQEIDPTGAGDIFAAAFIIDKVIKGQPIAQAARFAAQMAAVSVQRSGLDGIPSPAEILEILKDH